MSTSTPTTSLPTRQQLDEIDALLRRMLTLPSLGGEAAPTSLTSVTAPPIAAATIREVPPATPPVAGDPMVKSWRVEWPQTPPQVAQPPSVVAWGSPAVESRAELPPWATSTAPVSPPPFALPVNPTPPSMQAPIIAPPAASPAPVPRREMPNLSSIGLIALNGVFDILTYLLGPLGTWLRGSGRNVLGWVGIAMLIVSVIWAVSEWQGVEWPRPDLSRFGIGR